MDYSKLVELGEALPKGVKSNALNLIERMNTEVEGIGDETTKWYAPIMRLVQPMSDRSKLPKNATIGDLVIGEKKMDRPLRVIPIRVWESRQLWDPNPDNAKMLCSSPDAKVGYLGFNCKECPHAKYDEEAKKSECSKLETVMAITEDLSEIFVINFAKTNFSVGKEWKAVMKKAAVSPYKRVYSLNSETSKQYKNVESYKIELHEGADKETKTELLPFLQELFTLVGEDRKSMLDAFHKSVADRRQGNAPALTAPASDSEVAVVEYSGASNVSDLASNYSL